MTLNSLEYCTVETSDGINLNARIFKPIKDLNDGTGIVLVLSYSILGGSQSLLKGIALGLSTKGFRTIVFDMRGVLVYPQEGLFSRDLLKFVMLWLSANGPLIICLANRILLWVPLQANLDQIFRVCKWFSQNLSASRILLVGSFAGAPISGSALDEMEQVVGFVSLGYPFGQTASILFGRHHKSIQSPKPKLFVMGTRDGFTSVRTVGEQIEVCGRPCQNPST